MRRYDSQVYLRTKRRQAGATRWWVILRTFAFLVLGVGLALFYVWQNVQSVRIGYQIKERERTVLELSKQARSLEMDLAALKMPSRILNKIEEKGLLLSIPKGWTMVKLHEPMVFYESDLVSSDMRYDHLGSGSLLMNSKIKNQNAK